MKIPARIGVFELVAGEARLAVVQTGRARPVLAEYHVAALPDAPAPAGDEEADLADDPRVAALAALAGQVRQRPALFVLSLPADQAVVRTLSLPLKGARRVAAAVEFELEPHLAVPLEHLVIDHAILGEANGETQVLAVGLRRAVVEEQADLLAAAGVTVEGVSLDVAGQCALWRLGRKRVTGLQALLHVRAHGVTLAMVDGKSLLSFRVLPFTAAQVQENPTALARQVRNSLRAFQATWPGEAAFDRLTVTGVDLFTEERELLESGVGLPVAYEDPSEVLRAGGRGADRPGPDAAALAGVAVSAAGGGYGFDFAEGTGLGASAPRAMGRHAVFSGLLLLVAVLGYAGYCFIDYRANQAELQRLGDRIWQAYTDAIPPAARTLDERPPEDTGGALVAEALMADFEELPEPPDITPFTQPPFLDILLAVGQALPEAPPANQPIDIKEISMKDGSAAGITIQGETTQPDAVDTFYRRLRESDAFGNVRPPVRRLEGAVESFTITAER
jgi:hypothetical protein